MTDYGDTAMTDPARQAGSVTLPGADLSLARLGYGAIQLAGPGVVGPPRDPDAAVAVLREAVALGITHIDTSDYYGPHVTNRIIRRALHPYPDDLVIVTKVGVRRPADGSWVPALSRRELTAAVHDNLRHLGLDALDVVDLHMTGDDGHRLAERSLAGPLTALAELKERGLIRHLGLSNVTPAQLAEAQTITGVVCVQNLYHMARRDDDPFIDDLARQGIAYVPLFLFPLGGVTPQQSSTLSDVAARLGATSMQVALAWLLRRSPNILVIPGAASVAHLRENVAAAAIALPQEEAARLDAIGAGAPGARGG